MTRIPTPVLATALAVALAAVPSSGQEPGGSPQPAPTPTAGSAEQPRTHLDVIVLHNGERLEGRILQDTPDYLEIDLGGGAEVGFARSRAASVGYGTGSEIAPQPASVGSGPADDQWFVLVDGLGTSVGWLHAGRVPTGDGGLRLTEEWQFVEKDDFTAITLIEHLDAEGRAQRCYYRERQGERKGERISNERIVEAAFVPAQDGATGTELEVTRQDRDGREVRRYRVLADLSFPLGARDRLRRRARAGSVETELVPLFDPRTEELVVRSYAPGPLRSVQVDGRSRSIREVFAEAAGSRNSEWLDADARTVRREVNGPDLVAIPTSEAEARHRAAEGKTSEDPTLVKDSEGRFALRRPNPTWTLVDDLPEGQVVLVHDGGVAHASLVHLGHLDPALQLASAAEAVERWHRLLQPGFVLAARTPTRLKGRPAIRMEGTTRQGRKTTRTVMHVVEDRNGGWLVLSVTLPDPATGDLRTDMGRIELGIEFEIPSEETGLPVAVRRG